MTAKPALCPACGHDSWKADSSGRYTERIYLTWNDTESTYDINFDNRSDFDTDTEPWICWYCETPAPDEIIDQLGEYV